MVPPPASMTLHVTDARAEPVTADEKPLDAPGATWTVGEAT
jgi:hypothetical protein